jgi:D-lactate dehydrogenase
MNTAFFDLAEWEVPIIKQRCKELGLNLVKASTEPFDISHCSEIKNVEVLSVFLSKVDQSMIQELPNVKLISTRATGFDQIDTEFAKKRGITVIYLPSYAESTVAEYTMAFILMLSRRLSVTLSQCIQGNFDQKTTQGNDIKGKTLGIIGTGKIGCALIKMASGFGMNIICHDMFPKADIVEECKVQYVLLEELFRNSDIISIHTPYTKETHHLINMNTLKLLKKGVLLVNTARGSIVDISTIRQGLKNNIFGGVALDTFEGENIWIHRENLLNDTEMPSAEIFKQAIEAQSLLSYENVILTPHNAFNSYEARQRMIETTLSDIVTFCQKGNCADRIV